MHDVFYFTDVHGQLDLFQTMRDWCFKQDPECMIIYGGDACDRGNFGYDIMQALLDDPQVVYIRGNHEDMFIKAVHELMANNPDHKNHIHTIKEAENLISTESWLHYVRLSLRNHSHATIQDWLINGADMNFIDKLDTHTCYTFDLGNGLYFSHAGGTQEAFMNVNIAEYNGETPDLDCAEEMIWDRNYLGSWWDPNKIIVFGHTPTCYIKDFVYNAPYISENKMTPIAYKPRTKGENTGWHIAMDTGMTFNGVGYVLNCLTMQVTGFHDPDIQKISAKRPVEIFDFCKII